MVFVTEWVNHKMIIILKTKLDFVGNFKRISTHTLTTTTHQHRTTPCKNAVCEPYMI